MALRENETAFSRGISSKRVGLELGCRGTEKRRHPPSRHPGESRDPLLDGSITYHPCRSFTAGSATQVVLEGAEHRVPAFAGMTAGERGATEVS